MRFSYSYPWFWFESLKCSLLFSITVLPTARELLAAVSLRGILSVKLEQHVQGFNKEWRTFILLVLLSSINTFCLLSSAHSTTTSSKGSSAAKTPSCDSETRKMLSNLHFNSSSSTKTSCVTEAAHQCLKVEYSSPKVMQRAWKLAHLSASSGWGGICKLGGKVCLQT